jgi:hypothetical protein
MEDVTIVQLLQQSHPTSKNGSDLQIDRNGRSQPQISHNSPQHSSDHNPLLPVHLVGQLSDGNSSHGSLAFIDEESHSRSKVVIVNFTVEVHCLCQYIKRSLS